jgi:hypothetical protein
MEWHRTELKTRLMGEFLGVQVLAAWGPAPWDEEYPWRSALLLEGRALEAQASRWTHIVAYWGDAKTEEEARAHAEALALDLLEALPMGYVNEEDEEPEALEGGPRLSG